MRVPTMSLGSRSGVNWMRLNSPSSAAASAAAGQRFGEPGRPLEQDVPVGEQREQQRLDDAVSARRSSAASAARRSAGRRAAIMRALRITFERGARIVDRRRADRRRR